MIGADEGLYTLNLNEIHEASLELVSFLLDFNNVIFSCRPILVTLIWMVKHLWLYIVSIASNQYSRLSLTQLCIPQYYHLS